eukprot:CAMPEP_0203792648 /NCGR_PEP_ID=MMETSP0100_2-20121128/5383_1 /ASSEMBLY_ACC=CAM_ASM_000210 /TAXON_ID=96639 /ORGANISM=" , Strain NY0313808BC1" /LENGTH=421 /DNA_ID=CAMNT_0050696253 /DNA_START=819 /DNA_END=2084 /DNA_ORIENTATION=+
MENREVDEQVENDASNVNRDESSPRRASKHPVLKHRFVRHTLKIVFADSTAGDERYGGNGNVAILEGELILPSTTSSTVLIFMHPSGIQNLLPMPVAMARAGLHVITCASRYPNNDSCLVMEKVVIDLGAVVRHAREKLRYKNVVLAGWSGGGSLSSFYQAQAEHPTVTLTPAGDRVSLLDANLIPADALLILAAHISRAKIFTEWLDPAVLDEKDPSKRERQLDLYDPLNPNQPPYTLEYIERYRKAQINRNRRITKWVKERLKEIEANQGCRDWRQSKRDECFNVYCTQADIRRLDTRIDPNGRSPTPLNELAAENHSPVGLARFTTLRSWLSQWSYDESNADGPKSLASVSVPVLVLANESDHLVPTCHPLEMYNAVPHTDKKFLFIKDATHYYFGQTDLMAGAIKDIIAWLHEHGFE